jgi:apoptosis-inducing factor 2
VTLIHSRSRLLPIYDPQVHDLGLLTSLIRKQSDFHIIVMDFLSGLNVSVVLNSRLSMDSMQRETRDEKGQRILRTVSGEEFRADMVVSRAAQTIPFAHHLEQFLCTGSRGNVQILSKGLGENCVNPRNGLVRVSRTLQVDPFHLPGSPLEQIKADQEETVSEALYKTPFPHIFAIGDSADAFGAIKAGHTAYFQVRSFSFLQNTTLTITQGEVAARNVASLIKNGKAALLDSYVPGPPAIKVSVGLVSVNTFCLCWCRR